MSVTTAVIKMRLSLKFHIRREKNRANCLRPRLLWRNWRKRPIFIHKAEQQPKKYGAKIIGEIFRELNRDEITIITAFEEAISIIFFDIDVIYWRILLFYLTGHNRIMSSWWPQEKPIQLNDSGVDYNFTGPTSFFFVLNRKNKIGNHNFLTMEP